MKRLHSLKATEVSAVPTGANKKRFLVRKSAGTVDKDEMLKQVKEASPSLMARVTKILKSFTGKPDEAKEQQPEGEAGVPLTPAAQTALKATARILAPHKDEITDDHLDAVQQEIGIQGGSSGDEGDDENDDDEANEDDDDNEGDAEVKPEDMEKAGNAGMEAAKKAFKEVMAKLGYQKYPEPKFTMKSGKKKDDSEDDDDDEEEENEDVSKSATPPVKILKEDGTLNLDAVPAEMRPFAEVIAKQHVEAIAKAKAAEDRATASEKILKEHQDSTRKAEIVRKTGEFKNLKADDVQKTLEMADKVSKEEFDRVSKMFEEQNTIVGQSAIFKELGSGHSSTGVSDAWSKIEKAAEGIVQKADGKITPADAISQFLETTAGQNLYKEHQASRKDGV